MNADVVWKAWALPHEEVDNHWTIEETYPDSKTTRIQQPSFHNQPLKVDWNPRLSFQEQADSEVLVGCPSFIPWKRTTN